MNRPIRFMTQVDEYARGLSLVATSWWRGMQNSTYFSLASGGFNFSLTPYATHEMTLKTAAFELETHFSNLFRILQLIIRMVVAFVACGCLHSTRMKKIRITLQTALSIRRYLHLKRRRILYIVEERTWKCSSEFENPIHFAGLMSVYK